MRLLNDKKWDEVKSLLQKELLRERINIQPVYEYRDCCLCGTQKVKEKRWTCGVEVHATFSSAHRTKEDAEECALRMVDRLFATQVMLDALDVVATGEPFIQVMQRRKKGLTPHPAQYLQDEEVKELLAAYVAFYRAWLDRRFGNYGQKTKAA
jgi:hypothetical protein